MGARYLEIEQVCSPIRRDARQRKILLGLGLRKIGHTVWVPDTLASRGMIRKVSHLVRVNHDPALPTLRSAPTVHNEAEDVALMRNLAFDQRGITLEPFPSKKLLLGKTPDFKLIKDGELCGFCELKSPRDDFIFDDPGPDGLAVRKNVPFYRKLGSHIRKAAAQFAAENPDHAFPNVLVFVSHTKEIERRDLRATIAGLPLGNGKWLPLLPLKLQKQVLEAAQNIDLFLWIDAQGRTLQHLSINGAPHQNQILNLLGLSDE